MNECHLTRILRLVGKREGVEGERMALVASPCDADDGADDGDDDEVEEDKDDIDDADRCNGSVFFVNT